MGRFALFLLAATLLLAPALAQPSSSASPGTYTCTPFYTSGSSARTCSESWSTCTHHLSCPSFPPLSRFVPALFLPCCPLMIITLASSVEVIRA